MFIPTYYFVLSLIILVLTIILIRKKTNHNSKYLKNIPGPKPVFPIGNLWDFIDGSTVFLPVITKYFQTYGDTFVIYYGPSKQILITMDYDLLEYFYSSSEHIDKAEQYKYSQKWLGNGLLTSTGPKWRAHRKLITQSFSFSILKNFVSVFETVGQNLIKKLQKEAGHNSLEVSNIISLYTLDVICETAMGIKSNSLEGKNSIYVKNIKSLCEILIQRGFSPIPDILYPLTWNFYKEKRALKVIHTYVENIINERIKEKSVVKNRDSEKYVAFLDLLLQAKINDKPLTKQDIMDEVNTFMFEGHDTSSSGISFCLFMLATHPEVQVKVLKEQQEIFKDDIKNVKSSISELNNMKYLELVVKETLRLFPPVPMFGRVLTKDVEFNIIKEFVINNQQDNFLEGILYPKGLAIGFIPFIMHRNPKYYPEPEKFIPERFEHQYGKIPPYAYTPFSAGSRNCIGQKFARLEMLSVLSKIVRHFELGPATPEHKLTLAPELVLISKNGVNISIKNRVIQAA